MKSVFGAPVPVWSRQPNEVWDLESPTPVQCKFNGLHKRVSRSAQTLPAVLEGSFRLEWFSTRRHAVLNPKRATLKIFTAADPTARSSLLHAQRLLCPSRRVLGPRGKLGCQFMTLAKMGRRRGRIIKGANPKTSMFVFLSLALRKV